MSQEDSRRGRELGMHCPISRRDFLNGTLAGATGALLGNDLLGSDLHGSDPKTPGYYPPALTGMRGNHDGSYRTAHEVRDHTFWKSRGEASSTAETYDLVVVGAGISGLAAAYFYQKQAGTQSRILLLDNHDDFGGHAKRNEFQAGKRLLLSYGGTQSIEEPAAYSAEAKGLLVDLGIDTRRFYRAYNRKLYSSLKLSTGVFFDREHFGRDCLLAGLGERAWPHFLAEAPLSKIAKRDIARLYTEKVDYLPGKSVEEKRAILAKTSYADYLTKIAGAHSDVLPFFQSYTHDNWGVGIEAVAAQYLTSGGSDYAFTFPGFAGLGLPNDETESEPYIFHFPDGNASIARLLVHSLNPTVFPELIQSHDPMGDIVAARADYGALDNGDAPVRIRLNSTVVQASHAGGSAEQAKEVEVAYLREGKLQSVRAKKCVLACYNTMIPYICTELPSQQKKALAYGLKVPLVYTHVAIRNWEAFQRAGVHDVIAPMSYYNYIALDFPVSLGKYRFPDKPDQPAVLFVLRTPCSPGRPERAQHRAGRAELLGTPLATFEFKLRDQLQRMLGGNGFEAARDIEGITVNRWAHGYAYEYNSLWDPEWPEEELPCVIGRKTFGRIAIANSDAGAKAYTNSAIDQAYRAVSDLLRNA